MKDEDRDERIDDFITYAEDEEDSSAEETEDTFLEESVNTDDKAHDTYSAYTDEDGDEYGDEEEYEDEYDDEYDDEDGYIEKKEDNGYDSLIDVDELGFDIDSDDYEEKKQGHATRIGIIVGVMIGIIVIIAFITVDSGIIGSYKTNFANNFTRIFANFIPDDNTVREKEKKTKEQYKTDIISSIIVAPENMADCSVAPYKDGMIVAASNHLMYVNAKGETVWEEDTAIVDPLLAAEGNYILLGEKDRNKLCLYDDKKLLYDVDDPDNIMAVKISAKGDAVIVTNKSSYRGGVSVYNKSGEQIFSWASGSDTVISAAISPASRRVAVALLNTEKNTNSTIEFFDIKQKESISKTNADGTVIYNVEFSGSVLTAFGDNLLAAITDEGRVINSIVFDDSILTHSDMDTDGNKLLSFDDGEPRLTMYNQRGGEKGTVYLDGGSDRIDVKGKYVLYNVGRDIYFGKIGDKTPSLYTAAMDIKNLIILSHDTYAIVYSNSMEIIKI